MRMKAISTKMIPPLFCFLSSGSGHRTASPSATAEVPDDYNSNYLYQYVLHYVLHKTMKQALIEHANTVMISRIYNATSPRPLKLWSLTVVIIRDL